VLVGIVLGAQPLMPNNPVIGIMTLPIDQCSFTNGTSCIPSSYVRWLQSAGAQVVPFRYDLSPSDARTLYSRVNGVLFTGGGLDLALNSQYVQTAKLIYDLATSNKNDHFPLWGTCMGFQLLHILTAWNDSVLCEYCYDSSNISWPIYLTQKAKESRFFKMLSTDTVQTLTKENSTFNYHHDGITLDAYNQYPKVKSFFNILSINQDRKGRTFVSTVEAMDWPIYGIQWHAERNQFEFRPSYDIDHSRDAVRAMFDVANILVTEAMKNSHAFPSETVLQASLMENFHAMNNGFGTQEFYFS